MITGISIENFKLFGKRVDIELAPITLLFGRNSSGKSSVLQALEYARRVVVEGDTSASGELFGGFRSILHQGAGSTELAISVRLTPSPQALVQHLQMAQSPSGDEEPALKLEEFEYSLRVGLDTDLKQSFVKEYAVGPADKSVLAVTASAGTRRTVVWADVRIDEADLDFESPWFPLATTELVTEGQRPEEELVRPWFSAAPQKMESEDRVGCPNLAKWPSALPTRPFEVDVALGELPTSAVIAGHETLNRALLGSRALLGEYLSGIRHFGPIRMVPQRGLVDLGWPKREGWYDGAAAWALLQKAPSLAQDAVGPVLNTIGTGYSFLASEYCALLDRRNLLGRVRQEMKRTQGNADLNWVEQELERAPGLDSFQMFEVATHLRVHPRDVGVGVSQLVPVVAAVVAEGEPQPDGTTRPITLVAIEQPELHIHPALQCRVGDLFAEMIRDVHGNPADRQYLIETHSEHLVLRLLRRIRETTECGDKRPGPKLTPDDVAIYFFERVDGEAKVTRIRIDKDGEFLDRWPEGFFAERLQEL